MDLLDRVGLMLAFIAVGFGLLAIMAVVADAIQYSSLRYGAGCPEGESITTWCDSEGYHILWRKQVLGKLYREEHMTQMEAFDA